MPWPKPDGQRSLHLDTGSGKSDANLEVAKRENAVILYESDYKTRYAGFNPNSAESYIIFEFMQDKYMSQSVHLASLVQSISAKPANVQIGACTRQVFWY